MQNLYIETELRRTKAVSADPDQTASKEQSDRGLHCVPFSKYLYKTLLIVQNLVICGRQKMVNKIQCPNT